MVVCVLCFNDVLVSGRRGREGVRRGGWLAGWLAGWRRDEGSWWREEVVKVRSVFLSFSSTFSVSFLTRAPCVNFKHPGWTEIQKRSLCCNADD